MRSARSGPGRLVIARGVRVDPTVTRNRLLVTRGANMGSLRVLIDARVNPHADGGVQQVVEAMAANFGFAEDDTFTFVTTEKVPEGFRRPLPANVRHEIVPSPRWGRTKDAVRRLPGARRAYRSVTGPSRILPTCPVDERRFDVAHLAIQNGFRTELPYVYSPHDLQHLHLPELFTSEQRRQREAIYGLLASGASAIVMMTAWAARDLVDRMGVPADRVYVIPHGVPPSRPVDGLEASRMRRQLGVQRGDYALFPAQTWPHKNHLGLLEAVAALRADGLDVLLVCTGSMNRFAATVRERVDSLRLSDLVHFTGYVTDDALVALYDGARCVVYPSLFEGWGMPIFDALARGVPVAATNRCGLGEMLGGAASTFDPTDITAMATSIRQVWCDEEFRRSSTAAGRELTEGLTWAESCSRYVALYEAVSGSESTEVTTALLASATDWR